MDKDLASIQEARDLVNAAHEAWKTWSKASQEQVDRVCAAMAEAGYQASERLGRLAQEETGYGVALHKKLKNEFGSRTVWESIRELKTVGVIRHDAARRLYEIAWPMGVVAALVPSTNPTSTAFFKCLIAVKARDAIVVSPHPAAERCTYEAVQTMAQAAENAGAPKGLIDCLQQISLPGTQELMTHRHTAVILATGGTAMVRAAHSTGKPAYGVGSGQRARVRRPQRRCRQGGPLRRGLQGLRLLDHLRHRAVGHRRPADRGPAAGANAGGRRLSHQSRRRPKPCARRSSIRMGASTPTW